MKYLKNNYITLPYNSLKLLTQVLN
ncbi:hypothetical protein S40293_11590 [Stachybotrys chartarum IBT 40293]|nr:hypothetical protein S40293_11590 [Stachybotrys chartarum IBT 40293]